MKKEKALKHLANAIDNRNFWREAYVLACRDKSPVIDTKLGTFDGKTIREVKKEEAISEIKESNERISRFQRFAY